MSRVSPFVKFNRFSFFYETLGYGCTGSANIDFERTICLFSRMRYTRTPCKHERASFFHSSFYPTFLPFPFLCISDYFVWLPSCRPQLYPASNHVTSKNRHLDISFKPTRILLYNGYPCALPQVPLQIFSQSYLVSSSRRLVYLSTYVQYILPSSVRK